MTAHDEIMRANDAFAEQFAQGALPAPPARRFALVTCMDARLDPAKFLGLDDGDAHVIRNAGGLATDDALRSLALSHWLLGTREAFVIAHTGCGMLSFTNEALRERLPPAVRDVDFLPFADLDESVRSSVRRVRESPLLPDDFAVTGLVYDTAHGRLREVS
ncbi:MAG: beta-class carbonic anhydrase [Gaiellaceae bacterium]